MSFSTINQNVPQGAQEQNCTAGVPIGGLDANNIFRILKLDPNGNLIPGTTNATTAAGAIPFPLPPGAYGANVCLAFFSNLYSNNSGSAQKISLSPLLQGYFTAGNLLNIVLMYSGSSLSNYANTRNIGTDTFAPAITDISGALMFYHNYVFQPFGAAGAGQAIAIAAQPAQQTIVLPASVNLQAMIVAGGAVTNNGNGIYLGFNNFSY